MLKAGKRNKGDEIVLSVLMVVIMTFSGSLGAFFLKKGTGKLSNISLLEMIRIPEMYIGGVLYLLGAGTNIILLRRLPYTVVYPLTSLTYVWTMFISASLLKEKITGNKIGAVLLIIIGICFISL